MLANMHEYFNCSHYFYFLLSNLSNFLHVAFLLPVRIYLYRSRAGKGGLDPLGKSQVAIGLLQTSLLLPLVKYVDD